MELEPTCFDHMQNLIRINSDSDVGSAIKHDLCHQDSMIVYFEQHTEKRLFSPFDNYSLGASECLMLMLHWIIYSSLKVRSGFR